MVSVVTGSGAGLINSSKDVLGGAGEFGNAATGRAGERVTVNAATGNLVVQDRDEYLVGVGPDVDLLRTYNSAGGWDGDNGDNWRLGYYKQVNGLFGTANAPGSSIKRVEADGSESTYNFNGARYVCSDGAGQYDSLTFDGANWTWADGDTGVKERYELAGAGKYRLRQIADSDGNFVQVDYGASGLISTLGTYKAGTNTPCETLTLTYAGTELQKVSTSYLDAQGQSKTRGVTSYTYLGGRLNTVTTDLSPEDGNTSNGYVYTVRYGYDGSGRLNSIQQTDGTQITIGYEPGTGRVASVLDGRGLGTTFTYDSPGTTTIKDALGQATTLKYGNKGELLEISGATMGGGSFIQKYAYYATGDLWTSTNAKNETTTYEYNGAGALLRRTDAAGNVLERTYTPEGLVATETVYLMPDLDGVAGAGKASAPLTTNYYYDTASGHRRLQYVIYGDGSLASYVYDNVLGQLTDTFRYSPDVVFAGNRQSASEVGAFAANAFKTDKGILRTHHEYDVRGLLSRERTYASSTYNATTNALDVVDATDTVYTYDPSGRLISSQDATGVKLAYEYDGLGRVTKSVDTDGVATIYSYGDTDRETRIKLDNGQTTVQLFNRWGDLISSDVLGAGNTPTNLKKLGETRYSYDNLGRLWQAIDATGVPTYSLYDVSGRKSADIAANGQFTEYLYDGAGRLIQQIAYYNPLTQAALNGLTAISTATGARPVLSGIDRITTYYYDAAGRLTGVLDADGYLTQTRYDGTGAVTSQTTYANAVVVTRLDVALGTTRSTSPAQPNPTADALKDRTVRNLYDAAGRLVAQVDGDGGLTRWTYDAAGNRRSQLRRSQPLTDSQRATGDVLALSALALLADDEFTQWVYDGHGRQIAQLSAEGYLTEYTYDAAGRLKDTLQYLRQAFKPVVSGSPNTQRWLQRAEIDTMRPNLGPALKTSRSYNSRGLLERETAVDGTVTFHQYDRLQRLTSTTRAEGQAEQRVGIIDYDDWGRLLTTKTVGDATGVTMTYDAAGRRISVKDARGNTTFFYYDAQGRQVYAILRDPVLGGEVTETIYSNFNEVQVTVTHARRLSPEDSATLVGGKADGALATKVGLLSDSLDNRNAVNYNRRGLIQQAIDALGYKTDYSYNAFGQLSKEIRDADPAGTANARRLTLDYGYDRRGNSTRTERSGAGLAASVITASSFDALGRLYTTTDELSRLTQYTYLRDNGSGRKVTLAGPAGTASTTYDALDRVLTRVDRNANTVTYIHDAASRKLTVKTAVGLLTVTEYTRNGEVYKVTDGAGATTTYAYDSHGNLLTVTDALGNVTQNGFDANDNLVQVVRGLKANASGNSIGSDATTTTSYTFDAANRVLTQTVDPLVNGAGLNLQTRYEYDGQGRKLKITDPRGTISTQVFNAKGELTDVVVDDVTGGLKLKTSYSYDAQSRVLSVIEGASTVSARKTAYAYDILGRRVSEIVDPEGLKLKTSYEYDAAGRLFMKRDALNNVSASYNYDNADRLRYSIDALGAVTRYDYDGEGHVKGVRAYATPLAAGWASKTYAQLNGDLNALATSTSDQVSINAYDSDGRLIYSIDQLGQVAERKYDGANRVILERRYKQGVSGVTVSTTNAAIAALVVKDDAKDHVTRYAYDKAGNQRFVINAEGFVSERRYDAAGLVVATVEHEQPWTASISSLPTEAELIAVYTPTRTEFNTGLEGFAGPAGVWEGGRLKLISEPMPNGGWVYMTSAKKLAVGSTVKLDYLPVQIQQMPHIILKDGAGGLGRVAVIFKNDGHVYTQRRQPVTGTMTESDLGVYTPGKTYSIEMATTATGARVVIYEKGTPIASGMSYTVTEPTMNWQSVQLDFNVLRASNLPPGQTISYVDNIEELPPVKGRVTQFAYDAAGRQRFAVDAEGYVTETRYDDANSRTTTLRYASRLSGASNYTPAAFAPALSAFTAALPGLGSTTSVVRELDRAGRLSLQTDGNNVQTLFTYDVVGRLASEVQASNVAGQSSTTRYVYNTAGQRTAVVRGEGTALASTTRYEYDSMGRLWHQIDARGVALAEGMGTWERDERVRLGLPADLSTLSAADKAATQALLLKAYTTEYTYDANDRITKVTDTLGGVTQTEYDIFGNASVVTDARGYKRYQVYDKAGHLAQTIDAERYLTVYGYDAFGNLTTTTRVDAKVQGALAASQVVTLTNTAPSNGLYVLINAANDHLTGRLYDRNNRLLKETDAENYTEGTDALDAYGQRLTVKNKLGVTVTYSYDRLGRVLTETLPVQAKDGAGTLRDVVNEYQYDSRGNRTLSIEAKGLVEERRTEMRYDCANRMTLRIGMSYTAVAADTSATTSLVTPADAWRYDARGNLIETITHGQLSANGQTVSGARRTLASYDVLDRKTLEIAPDRVVTRYGYDVAGNEITQIRYGTLIADTVTLNAGAALPEPQPDPKIDRTLRTTYDALNRKMSVSVDSLQTWDSNSASMVISNLQPQNVVLQRFFYDAMSNVTERIDGRGNASKDYFDGLGHRVMSIDAAGAVAAWTYERAGGVATKETRYGQVLSMAAARQADKLSGLNAANDPVYLASALASQPPLPVTEPNRVTAFVLDRLDRVTERRVKDVAYDNVDAQGKRTSGTADAVTTYTYNGLGAVTRSRELAALTGGTPDPQVWEQTDIQYDGLGREVMRIAPGFKDYQGDTVNPRTEQVYDGLGRVVQNIRRGKDNAADSDDQFTRYKFDSNGQLVSTTNAENAVTAYSYDAEGNLSRRTFMAVKRADGTTRNLVTTYQYDASGRQTASLDVGTQELRRTRYNAFGEVSARGLGNGWEEFAEYNALGKVIKTNSGDGAIKFYVYDAAGNVTREIRGNGDSTVDLIGMTLKVAAESNKMYSRISVYNSRNLLVKTMDPQIEMLRDTDSLGSLYTEKYEAAWMPSAVTTTDSVNIPWTKVTVVSGANPTITFYSASATSIAFSYRIMASTNQLGAAGIAASPVLIEAKDGHFTYDLAPYKNQGWIAFTMNTVGERPSPGNVGYSVNYGEVNVDPNGVTTLHTNPEGTGIWTPAYINWPINPALVGTSGTEFLDYTIYSDTGAKLYSGMVDGLGTRGPQLDVSTYRGSTIRIDYTRSLGHEKASLRATIDSQGHITTNQTAAEVANKVNIYVKGREITKGQLSLGGVPFRATGVYVKPTATSFGYTQLTFDVQSNFPNGGTFDFKMTAVDQYELPVTDEFGAPIVQEGRVVLGTAGSEPMVFDKVSALKISNKEIITKLQDFNAFGEVVQERDDRVQERMLASINAERKRQGLTDTVPLSAAQIEASRTTLKYNALGLLVAKTDPETWVTETNGYRYRARPVTAYGYDLLGRHTTTLDANGQLSRTSQLAGSRGEEGAGAFDFDAMGGAGAVFDAANGGVLQRQFDVFGNLRRVIDAKLGVVEQDYDKMGRLKVVTRKNVERYDGAGQTSRQDLQDRYEYDELGQRIRFVNALGNQQLGPLPPPAVTTDYDSLGRVVKTITVGGAVTEYRYQQLTVQDGVISAIAGAAAGGFSGGFRRETVHADGRSTFDWVEYFGHTTTHLELTGAKVTYSYDSAGRLATQTSTAHIDRAAGQKIKYSYYANGYIRGVTDESMWTLSQYTYDNAGNRVSESYGDFRFDANGAPAVSSYYQNSTVIYDELSRIERVEDAKRYNIRYEYDAVGNRRMIDANYWDGASGGRLDRQTYWYAYDALNRFVVSKGQLNTTANGEDLNRFANAQRGTSRTDTSVSIVAGVYGIKLGYDKNSQRISAEYLYGGALTLDNYTYSSDGYLQLTYINSALKISRELDALGRTVAQHDIDINQGNAVQGQHTMSSYDVDNRLQSQSFVDDKDAKRNYTLTYSYYDAVSGASALATRDADTANLSATGKGELAKTVLHMNTSGADTSKDTVTRYVYEYWDTAQQYTVTKTAPGAGSGNTQLTYDVNGHLALSYDSVAGVKNTFITTANGLILSRSRQANGVGRVTHHNFYYVDSNRIGDVGDTPDEIERVSYAEQLALKDARRKNPDAKGRTYGTVVSDGQMSRDAHGSAEDVYFRRTIYGSTADFDQNYEPINDNYPGHAASVYTVNRDGETLASISQTLWGDAAMWYLIADANGLSRSAVLKPGQLLVIPNKVTNIHNNSTTWRPYKAGEAIGRTDPTVPTPQVPKERCEELSFIVGAVVTIAVSILLEDPVTGAAAGDAARQYAAAALNGRLNYGDLLRGGGSRSIKSGLFAGLGPAAGSGFDDAMSHPPGFTGENEYDYRSTAIAVAAAYAGQAAASGAANSGVSWMSGTTGQAVAAGAAVSATSQALRGNWSWRTVMISALSAGVGSEVSSAAGSTDWGQAGNGFGERFAGGLTAGLTARSLSSGNRQSYETVFASTLGSAIGESLASQRSSSSGVTKPDANTVMDAHIRNADVGSEEFLRAFTGMMEAPLPVDSSNSVLVAGPGGAPSERALQRNIGDLKYLSDEAGMLPRGRTTDLSGDRLILERPEILSQLESSNRANYADGESQATAALYEGSAGDVRTILTMQAQSFEPVRRIDPEPLSPLAQALTFEVELPPRLVAVGQGIGDLMKEGILATANMTVLPLADTVQAALKFLHGAVTGDYQPLNSLSSFGAPGSSTWDGLKSTGANVFNVSPAGMVYHAYTGAKDTTSALISGDLRRATSSGLGLGLTFAAARGAGMGDYGFTVTDVRGAGMGRFSQAGAIGIKFGKLTFDKTTKTWTSPEGLNYGEGSIHGNRVKHVLDHAQPNLTKPVHSIFNVARKDVIGLVDEAWRARGSPLPNDPAAYVIPMGRIIGTAGEMSIKIIVRPGTANIVTAHPI